MKLVSYTSCSINYLAKARVLAESLRRHHPDAVLVLCMNDVLPEWFDASQEPFDDVWTPHDLGYDESWVFQHDVMELCTAVKGRALVRLLDEYEGDLFAYFDPDVCVYAPLNVVQTRLENRSIGLVPHMIEPETSDVGIRMSEMSVTHHGIYNLGHLFVKKDDVGNALATWWADRLDRYCFNDPERGLFTDQRWMDLVPSIFDRVAILRTPDLDVASWNVRGRRFGGNATDGFTVNGMPLLTYHFSGTGIMGTHQRVRMIFNPADPSLAEIEREYEAAIDAHDQQRLGHYGFGLDWFDNGEPVNGAVRTFYRRHADLQAAFPEPYATDLPGLSLYAWLSQNRPELVQTSTVRPHALSAAFASLFDDTFYLARYDDARSAIEAGDFASAIDHYIRVGSALGYQPNVYFDSDVYREKAQYLEGHTISSGSNVSSSIESTLLGHYLTHGLANGIEPNCYFDSREYLAANPDVMQAIRVGLVDSALEHFYHAGDRECRSPCGNLPSSVVMERDASVRQLVEQGVVRGPVEALIVLNRLCGFVEYDLELDVAA